MIPIPVFEPKYPPPNTPLHRQFLIVTPATLVRHLLHFKIASINAFNEPFYYIDTHTKLSVTYEKLIQILNIIINILSRSANDQYTRNHYLH